MSIAVYLFLACVKLAAGHFGQSEGLMADGLNNSTDVISSIAVLIGLIISQKPPDDNHAYGHYRAESIASLVAAFIMLSVGAQVIFDGVRSLFTVQDEKPDMLTAWIALACALTMYVVYLYNLRLSKKINSPSIKAVAYDNRSDAFVSIGAFIGIIGTHLGFRYLDTIAAVLVGIIICKTAWEIFRDSSHTLTDGIDTELLASIEETIIHTPGVLKADSIKARTQGHQILVEATIYVNPNLNVVESYTITEMIEEQLKKKHHVTVAMIHIEPFHSEIKTC